MGRKGRAVQIVTPKEDSFVLEDGILNGILGKDELKGMKLYVLCVAGAFRKGKSFLLSLLIMYLESQNKRNMKTLFLCGLNTRTQVKPVQL
ncbi:Atlastin-2 [Holothuria leucospilota]|uniref:Atlastin-2 n=1 Tax=Holothuria leucospilota TaxID=206669 RepID=A0A9Q1HFJ4_HOLLE|nr:Atlastin-2 [Holothuria leucospilota]